MTPRHLFSGRRMVVTALAVGALAVTAACGSSGSATDKSATDKGSVTISGQNFPEATVVADLYQQVLEHAGYQVTVKLVGTRDVYMAKGQFPGSVDVVPEYLAGIADYLNTQKNGSAAKPISSPDVTATLSAAQALATADGITLLAPAAATDQNAFFTSKKFADANKLTDLSSLGALGKAVTLASAPDCDGRTDCAGGLKKTYGIKISKILPLGFASAQVYQSVIKGESQLGETSTTDGSLVAQGLVLLPDDQHVQPAQNLLPAVSTAFLTAHPDVKTVLDKLIAVLTTDDLIAMNGSVGNDRQKPADVAKKFLQDKGLI